MAKGKKDGKTGKKTKKAASAKLPKRIGGSKIPKEFRADGERLIALLSNPVVTEIVAAGLIGFGEGLRNRGKPRGGDGNVVEKARDRAGKAVGELGQVAALLGTLLAAKAAWEDRPAGGEEAPPSAG